MNLHCQIGISVSKTDNGWVLEWKDEDLKRSRYGLGLMPGYDDARPTRGIEVFQDKDKLLERVKQLI